MRIAILLILFAACQMAVEDDAKYGEFWIWFVKHEKAYRELDHGGPDKKRRDVLYDELTDKLHRVNKNLTFEFGPILPVRDFVISADGRKAGANDVVKLVDAAPDVAGWKYTKFRQVRALNNGIIVNGNRLDFEKSKFYVYKLDDGKLGLLFLVSPDSYKDYDALRQSVYLTIDGLIGEKMAMELIEEVIISDNTHGLYKFFLEKSKAIDHLPASLKEIIISDKNNPDKSAQLTP